MQTIIFLASTSTFLDIYCQSYIVDLAKRHNVIVVTSGEVSFAFKGSQSINLSFIRTPDPLRDLISLFKVVVLLRSLRPNLVVAFTPKVILLSNIARFFVRGCKIISVFTGQVWVTELGFKRWFLKKLDMFAFWASTQVIVDSPNQLKFLVSEGFSRRSDAIVLGKGGVRGVSDRLASFGPSSFRSRQSQDVIRFCFLGRISRAKGCFVLLEAFQSFASKNKLKLELVFVGQNELEGEDAFVFDDALASNQWLKYCPFTLNPEVVLQTVDVICLPSFREGFALGLVEAATLGIPCIASDIYGVNDFVVNEVNGLLVAPGDVEQWKTAIARMFEPNEWIKFSKGAQLKSVGFEDYVYIQSFGKVVEETV